MINNIGYNNRWIRLIKDIVFVGLGVWLVTRSSWLAVFLGVLGMFWYGRDAWYQAKVLWQEKHYRPATDTTPQSAPRNDKITVTNPSDVKEVDYNKE